MRTVTAIGLVVAAAAGASGQVYSEDFSSGSAGAEWNTTAVTTAPSGEQFLGRFANQNVELSLADIAAHDQLTVSFSLYIINTMDGGEPFVFSADGTELFRTTFSNNASASQSYPNPLGGSTNAPRTGALPDSDTLLGYTPINGADLANAVYEISYTFDHSSPTLVFGWMASGLQGISDESWGIDNIVVTIPAPASAGMLAFAGLAASRRRR